MTTDNTQATAGDFTGRTLVDPQGDKVGTVFDLYLDTDTRKPEWLAVTTGMFGTRVSFVPIEGVGFDTDGNVVVPYDKALIKDAPHAEADGQLSEEEERALYNHYGRTYRDTAATLPPPVPATPANGTSDAASMVRSEEELSVNKHSEEAGRVKLRKWVETENVNLTVPVQRQMARVVREPATGTDSAGDFVEGEEEIVLSKEVVDVSKHVVAKERVGLETETETEQVPVDETVRKERIGVEGDVDDRGLGDAR
ncbi:MAG: photosystem reaction center subunit [Ilumatobacteraceae bacterium]|nr:photosystem reaction center subunit [Ilumatobacteraceae bacterium]